MSIIAQISHSYVCERCKATKFICNYCDSEFNSRLGVHVDILKHIGIHHTLVSDSRAVSDSGILDIDCDGNSIYSGYLVNVFPQLCLLKIIDINQYKKYMNDVFCKRPYNIYVRHVLNEITEENADDEYELSCTKGAILARNLTYCCAVCELEYENGIPDIHMVVRHFCSCYATGCAVLIKDQHSARH